MSTEPTTTLSYFIRPSGEPTSVTTQKEMHTDQSLLCVLPLAGATDSSACEHLGHILSRACTTSRSRPYGVEHARSVARNFPSQ